MPKGKWHGGKGSTFRPVDPDAFATNWDRIFNNGKTTNRTDSENEEDMAQAIEGRVEKK